MSDASPFEREGNWKKLLGAVYDTMGAEFLADGLRERGVLEEEIEQIMRELAPGEEG